MASGLRDLDEKYVCAECFDDDGLASFVRDSAEASECSYCGASSSEDEPIAAPLDDVVEHISECLSQEFEDPAECLPYESREGGYFGAEVYSTYDVVDDAVGLAGNEGEEELREDIADGLGIDRDWCRKNPFQLKRGERLKFSWDAFCRVVKHERRFFFAEQGDEFGELFTPARMLEELATLCKRANFVVSLDEGTKFYRARQPKKKEKYSSALDLGPPPEDAPPVSNRMSPPGIVMTYLALDAKTAIAETVRKRAKRVRCYVGEFSSQRALRLLDLARLPEVPSLFLGTSDSDEETPDRHGLIFLSGFVADVAKPIARDDRVHVAYVPTQVVTEYFRSEYEDEKGRLDGLMYKSAQNPDGVSVVLFGGQELLSLKTKDVKRWSKGKKLLFPREQGFLKLVRVRQRKV